MRPRVRRPRLELLEARWLPATLIEVELVAVPSPTAQGSSQLPTSLTSVSLHEAFTVEVWWRDVGSPSLGVTGGQVDIAYTTALIDASNLVHQDYDVLASGTIDDAQGRVDNFGGATFSMPAPGRSPNYARLGYFQLTAIASGTARLVLEPGALAISRADSQNVAWSDVDLGSLELLIMDDQVESVRLVGDRLVVTGTDQDDVILVSAARGLGDYLVRLNSRRFGPFRVPETGQLIAFGRDGTDVILVGGNVGRSAELYGGEGRDYLAGSRSADLLVGGGGDDLIQGGAGDDLLLGGGGDDRLRGEQGHDLLSGGEGNDILQGSAGDDLLLGGSGVDLLLGGLNSDLLIGGPATGVTDSATQPALRAILGQWTSQPTRMPEGISTIPSDGARDQLRGEGGADRFFADMATEPLLRDQIADLLTAEGDDLLL